jgi:hypothetical protein
MNRVIRYPPSNPGSPDFSRLSCEQAIRRVQQLRSTGLCDHTIAGLCGWNVGDVRRAVGHRTWMRP